jgi:2-succinyl-5-enolpyruvyl-6-hydroxy-3-cyclohexene-1-carboxylate synthase
VHVPRERLRDVNSPAVARALLEELIAGGVRDVVLAPGSRSAPISLALADAERRGLLRLHVRIDERSAAYLALGLARGSGAPVAVVTTSGTAAVNLHPAIVEAAYSGVPIVAVTADRPGAMRGSGANQTIDQRDLFGGDVVAGVDLEGLDESELRRVVADALDLAVGDQPGPLHLNIPLSEPLVATGAHAISDVRARTRDLQSSRQRPDMSTLLPAGVNATRGLLIAGDFDDPVVRADAAALAESLGWPIVSEPSGNLSSHALALRHGPLLLSGAADRDLIPDVVVTVGRVGLHRSVSAVIRAARVHIAVDVPPRLGRVDPLRTASVIVDAVPAAGDGIPDPAWAARWTTADAAAARLVTETLDVESLTGPSVARIVAQHAGPDDLLVVGASWPVRHVSSYAGSLAATCIGNRGTSGIDGVMSTAWGAALTRSGGTTYALIGDLTAIYDRNGLLAPASEPRPRLDYVVIDNDGGGIFSSLEQGAREFAADFERVFGTPHGADLGTLLAAPGIEVTTVDSVTGLRSALERPAEGVRVIIARCAARADEADLIRSVQSAVDAALS